MDKMIWKAGRMQNMHQRTTRNYCRNATDYDNYPLYHSLYETPFTNEHIFDTDNLAVSYSAHQMITEEGGITP